LVKRRETTANQDALFANTLADELITGTTKGVFGISTNEQEASRAAAHAGWVLRTEGSGGRAGRVQYEVLVAGKSISGDADDDTVIPDYTISITSQPQDNSATTGSAVDFDVTAVTVPAGGTLTYQWQLDSGGGFGDLSDAGVYSGTSTATLSISDNTGLSGNIYRVVLDVTGASSNVASDGATLTEV